MTILEKLSLIILVIIAFLTALVLVTPKTSKQTDNNIPAALPAPLETTIDCEDEIRSLWKNNNQPLSQFQVQTKELSWQKDKYTAIIYKCPDENQSYQNVFVLNKDKSVIFTMVDERFDSYVIRDINKDGSGELLITHGNSGNCWNCQGQSVFQIVNGEVKDLFPDQPIPEGGKYANVWLSDVNGDGIEDVLVTNDSWEISDGFFHSNAPGHTEVITWKDGKYQRAGAMLSKYYLDQIAVRNKDMQKLLKDKTTGLNDIVSLAVENYWDFKEIEKNDEGYANFILQTSLETLPKTIVINDSDKIWLLGIRNEIEKEYKQARPTIMALY